MNEFYGSSVRYARTKTKNCAAYADLDEMWSFRIIKFCLFFGSCMYVCTYVGR